MKKLTVKTPFEITSTPKEKVIASVGDVLTVSDRGVEFYNIHKVNKTQVFSIWMRKTWVNSKCN